MANLLAMSLLQKITSRDNDRIKNARRVRDGRVGGKIFLEGLRLIGEAAKSRTQIDSLFVTDDVLDQLDENELASWLRPERIYHVPDSILQSIADTNTSQGIIAIADPPPSGPELFEDVHTRTIPVVIFLNQINNPSNLGAIMRTAEAAGVAGVIVSAGSADVFSPKALLASMGSSLRLPVWVDVDFDDAIRWASAKRLRTVAADIRASRSYASVDWQIPRILVLGSEAHGLDESMLAKINEVVLIPMEKDVESLNLAVACGVILFEARRRAADR